MNGAKREKPEPAFIPCGDSFEKIDAMGADALEKALSGGEAVETDKE